MGLPLRMFIPLHPKPTISLLTHPAITSRSPSHPRNLTSNTNPRVHRHSPQSRHTTCSRSTKTTRRSSGCSPKTACYASSSSACSCCTQGRCFTCSSCSSCSESYGWNGWDGRTCSRCLGRCALRWGEEVGGIRKGAMRAHVGALGMGVVEVGRLTSCIVCMNSEYMLNSHRSSVLEPGARSRAVLLTQA
jgi:hypothetical protein